MQELAIVFLALRYSAKTSSSIPVSLFMFVFYKLDLHPTKDNKQPEKCQEFYSDRICGAVRVSLESVELKECHKQHFYSCSMDAIISPK